MVISGIASSSAQEVKFKTPDFAYPQTVIADAKALLDKADGMSVSDIAGESRLRAVIELCVSEQSINYDTIFSQPAFVAGQIEKCGADSAARAMLILYEAKLYSDIYNRSSYKYNQVDAPLEPYPADVSEWSGRQFRTRISDLLAQARKLAGSTPLSRFSASVAYNNNALQYLPTVADFALYETIMLTPATDSIEQVRRKLYAEGAELSKAGTAPYFYWKVGSITSGMIEMKDYASLKELYEKWKSVESARYILQAVCNNYQPYRFSKDEDALAEKLALIDLLRQSLKDFPKWYDNASLTNLLNGFTNPEARISVENVVGAGRPFEMELNYSFAKKIDVTIHALPEVRVNNAEKMARMPVVASQSLEPEKIEGTDTLSFTLPKPGKYGVVVKVNGDASSASSTQFYATPLSAFTAVGSGNNKDVAAVVTDYYTGAPLKGVDIRLNYNSSKKKPVDLGVTASDGTVMFNRDVVGNSYGNYLSFTYQGTTVDFNKTIEFYPSRYSNNSISGSCLILTDRSIYHPGDTISWAVVVSSSSEDGVTSVLPDKKMKVTLKDVNAQITDTVEVTTDAYGRAYGSFATKTDALTGYYRVIVEPVGEAAPQAVKSVMVSDFKAPQIEVTVNSIQRDVPVSGAVTISGRVATYSGMPVADASVEVSVEGAYRWRWYVPQEELGSFTVKTDVNGDFTAEIPASMLAGENYTDFVAKFNATSLTAETASASASFTTGKPYVISMDVKSMVNLDDPFTFTVNAIDANGADFQLPVRWSLVNMLDSASVATGEAVATVAQTVDLSHIKAGRYNFVVEPVDTALAKEYKSSQISFYSIHKNALPVSANNLFVPKTSVQVKNSEARVTVGTNCDRLYVYAFVRNGETLGQPKVHKLGRGFSTLKIAMPENIEDAEIILATVYEGKFEEVTVEPVVAKAETVEIVAESFRDRLVPSQKETWRFRLQKGQGTLPDAAFIATMYNRALDALEKGSWPTKISFMQPAKWVDFNSVYLYSVSAYASLGYRNITPGVVEWPEFRFSDMVNTYGGVRFRKAALTAGVPGLAVQEFAKNEVFENEATLGSVASADEVVSEDAEDEAALEEEGVVKEPAVEYRDAEVLQAFWRPDLVSDSEGNIDLVFTVPNANATWVFKAFGWTKDTRSASYEGIALANKPVMVQPNLPRFLRQGDCARVLATVYNNTEEDASVSTTVELFHLGSGEVFRTVTSVDSIPAKSSAIVAIDVDAPTTEASVGYRVRAVSGGFADGEQSAIPVLASSSTVIESTQFYLNPGDSRPFEFTVESPSSSEVTLQYCQNPVWTVVKAMRGIWGEKTYGAGATVSKLFSALAASHIVSTNASIASAIREWSANPSEEALESMLARNETLKTLLLDQTPWVQASKSAAARMGALVSVLDPAVSAKAIEECKATLAKQQNADGGFRWCDWLTTSSVWTTENVLVTLGIARSLGLLPADFDPMLEKAFGYLQTQATLPKKPSTDETFALVATYFPGFKTSVDGSALIRRTITSVGNSWKSDNTLGKAYDVMILNGNGRKAEAARVLASIRQFAVNKPGQGMCFPNISDIRAYATIIQAYAAMDAPSSELDALRQWILVRAQATDNLGAWNPDYLIAAVLMTGSDWTSVPVAENVTVNGKALKLDKVESSTGYFCQTLPSADGAQLKVAVRPNGVTPSYGSVITVATRPAVSVEARPSADLSLEKRCLVERDGEWVETDNFNLGERVRVQLTVKAGRDMEYVAITDERASTFAPVDQLPGYVWDGGLSFYRENLDASTRLFVSWLPKGTYHISYDMTAAAAGSFVSGIATIQSQYAPELTAHSGGTTITVK